MSEPTFGQIPAVIGGCPDPGWDIEKDRELGTVTFTNRLWPDWSSHEIDVKADGGVWQTVQMTVGKQTSNTEACKAHKVSFTVFARNRVVLRLRDPETGAVVSKEWFRHLRNRP